MNARPFRSHETVPSMQNTVLQGLAAEWVHLHATTSADVFSQWAADHPTLATRSLGELVDLFDSQTQDAQDQMLESLLALTQTGDRLASRTLLQVMLPRLVRMARSFRPATAYTSDLDDQLQHALSAFYAVVTEFPLGRHRGVAGHLKLAVLNRATGHTRRAAHSQDAWHHVIQLGDDNLLDVLTTETPHESSSEGTPGQSVSSGDELLDLILAARREGLLSPADSTFLAELYLEPRQETRAEAAERLGLTADCLRRRHHRIQGRLRAAVAPAAQAA